MTKTGPGTASTLAMVVPYRFLPALNGGHKAALGFCEFVSKEQELYCISTKDNEEELASFPVEKLLGTSFLRYFSPAVFLRCIRFFRKKKIQYVILHQPFIGLVILPAALLSRVRMMVFVQNIEYQRFRTLKKWWWPLLYPIEWLMFRASNHLLFISPDDQPIAQRVFGTRPEKCTVIPYGTPHQAVPADAQQARREIRERHGYTDEEYLIIFFGPQSYLPNLEAVERILHQINPLLLQYADFKYRFLICGGGLPAAYDGLKDYREKNIEYLGFVEDIEAHVKAADIMINPINSGGGVKTKIIEAIALGKTVLSSITGAKGVDQEACGEKLIQVGDEDFEAFYQAIQDARTKTESPTPSSFFATYYWANAVQPLNELLRS